MRSDDEGMNDEVQNLTPSMIGRLMSGVSYCSHDSARSGIFHWASKLQAQVQRFNTCVQSTPFRNIAAASWHLFIIGELRIDMPSTDVHLSPRR